MTDALVTALIALCEREGGARKVADLAGHNDQSIYQIINGVRLPSGRPRGVGRLLRERLDRAFPGWIDIHHLGDWTKSHHPSEGAQARGKVIHLAHQVSHPQPSIDPITLRWESILSTPLPSRFRLEVPDDAMALDDPPSMRAGDFADFAPASQAQPNQVVLLADKDGNVYIRRYTLRRPGHWIATARHSGYEPLDSIADGLRVLAIQVGASWG